MIKIETPDPTTMPADTRAELARGNLSEDEIVAIWMARDAARQLRAQGLRPVVATISLAVDLSPDETRDILASARSVRPNLVVAGMSPEEAASLHGGSSCLHCAIGDEIHRRANAEGLTAGGALESLIDVMADIVGNALPGTGEQLLADVIKKLRCAVAERELGNGQVKH